MTIKIIKIILFQNQQNSFSENLLGCSDARFSEKQKKKFNFKINKILSF